jgi:hypothetical protein
MAFWPALVRHLSVDFRVSEKWVELMGSNDPVEATSPKARGKPHSGGESNLGIPTGFSG